MAFYEKEETVIVASRILFFVVRSFCALFAANPVVISHFANKEKSL